MCCVSARQAAPEPLKQAAQSAKAQEFAGLGAQRTLDFLAAWDQLALRLPPQVGIAMPPSIAFAACFLSLFPQP